jgi:hypothetical protein
MSLGLPVSDTKTPSDGQRPQPATQTLTHTADRPNIVILPPETVREAAASGTGLQLTITTAHAGPLPAPATLREYAAIVPDLPKVLIDEFQNEARHRRTLQSVGQYGALGVAGLSIICGALLGYALNSPLAAFAVIGPVCGVVGTAQLLEFWFKAK